MLKMIIMLCHLIQTKRWPFSDAYSFIIIKAEQAREEW